MVKKLDAIKILRNCTIWQHCTVNREKLSVDYAFKPRNLADRKVELHSRFESVRVRFNENTLNLRDVN